MDAGLHVIGSAIAVEELSQAGIAYLGAVRNYPHVEFIEAAKTQKGEAVIFDALVGVPPRSASGIRRRERLAIEVVPNERPSVVVLRRDFPVTPHQNINEPGLPRTLCLSERSWPEDRPLLTPQRLIRQVTDWLERAVHGRLHLPGQPLEPFLFSCGELVVDRELLDAKPGEVLQVDGGVDGKVFTAKRATEGGNEPAKWLLMPVETAATDTLVISNLPAHFRGLADTLAPVEVDLVSVTQDWTRRLVSSNRSDLFDARWLFLVRIPRIPLQGDDLEEEVLALLLTEVTVGELGVALNVLGKQDGRYGLIIGGAAPDDAALDVGKPVPLNPTLSLNRGQAQRMSGLPLDADWSQKMAMVGLGALGSQVGLLLVRQGIGNWTYIDKDLLLPHNLTRHALLGFSVGHPKARHMDVCTHTIMPEADPAGFTADIFEIATDSAAGARLSESKCILDFTTSRAALRHIADYPSEAIRFAGYITASKRHLVLMCEGAGRVVRIDDLDVQFSAECATNDDLSAVLTAGSHDTVRYAGGCGDATVVLPSEVVTTLAGVCTAKVKSLLTEPQAGIWLWELSEDATAVQSLSIACDEMKVFEFGTWQVRIRMSLLQKVYSWRKDRLPNETGGILLGCVDVARGIIYVSDALPSPPDSQEWPTCYYRGVKGLYASVKAIEARSGGEIGYIGEWHSHPGSCPLPSGDDKKATRELARMMSAEGLPGMLLIVADGSMVIEVEG